MNDKITPWDLRLIQLLLVIVIAALTCMNYQVWKNQKFAEHFVSQELEDQDTMLQPDSILKDGSVKEP